MKQFLVFIFLITFPIFSFSKNYYSIPQIVLLTSLNTPRIWYRSSNWQISSNLENIFKYSFERSEYKLKVVHNASLYELHKELVNPRNIGVYWVSHASDSMSLGTNIQSSDKIVTIDKVDVKDAFSIVHPNMKYVGIVGCNAKNIVKRFENLGHYFENKNLKIHSFDKKVSAVKGLKESILASVKYIGAMYFDRYRNMEKKRFSYTPRLFEKKDTFDNFNFNFLCPKEKKGVRVELRRENNTDRVLSEVIVRMKGGIIAFLPRLLPRERQSIDTYIPTRNILDAKALKIYVESKHLTLSKKELGEVNFLPSWSYGNWKLKTSSDGKPIGLNKNIYDFTGELPGPEKIVDYKQFKCLSDLELN